MDELKYPVSTVTKRKRYRSKGPAAECSGLRTNKKIEAEVCVPMRINPLSTSTQNPVTHLQTDKNAEMERIKCGPWELLKSVDCLQKEWPGLLALHSIQESSGGSMRETFLVIRLHDYDDPPDAPACRIARRVGKTPAGPIYPPGVTSGRYNAQPQRNRRLT
ncbi:uncharacterized protein LOC134223637 [Armigeres subalbatus]|uniref:uncharacterized protein LOC134223637 n=1 Tax=Armigeres subalbatus TaxID=124917 RepID=UPI002ED47578